MKLFISLTLLLLLGSCMDGNGSKDQESAIAHLVDRTNEISELDRIFLKNPGNSEIYAEASDGKVSRVGGLEGISGLRFSYHLFRDENGKVRIAAVVPRAIGNDLYSQYLHYFDEQGKTIAFKRSLQYFDLNCSQEMILLTETEYYTTQWDAPETTTDLHTESGKVLDPGLCVVPYRDDYRVYPAFIEWMKATGVKVSQ